MNKQKSIIIIDDEAAIRNSFILALEDENYKVEAVDSGEKGLGKLKANRYDLIYLDLKMPGMNGVEVLRKLREFDKESQVYIITSYHKEFLDELKDANDDGCNFEVLQKPINSGQIQLVTRSILG